MKLIPPQPAPRLLTGKQQNTYHNVEEINANFSFENRLNSSNSSTNSSSLNGNNNRSEHSYENGDCMESAVGKGFGTPPPLPPKPKIKPNNWTPGNLSNVSQHSALHQIDASPLMEVSPRRKQPSECNDTSAMGRTKHIPPPRSIYLDQPNSSFV